ncbi:MAG: polysaccharide deacetylase family protein [Ignavibacteriaceae bacterium]
MNPDSTFVKDRITFWELFFIQNKISYEVIDDEQLESGLSSDYSVLVLPQSFALSDDEIISIQEFNKEGNSIFANMNVGEKDEKNNIRSAQTLTNIFGISIDSNIPKSEISKIHSICGNTPLSNNIPVGFRLRLTTTNLPIKAKVISPSSNALGYWYNDDFPYAGLPIDSLTTGIVYGKKGSGKFVWIGFDLNDVVGTEVHQNVLKNLLLNSFEWLNDSPIAWIETWPKGKKSAAVISCDVEFQFENINNALDIIEDEKIEGQYFILADVIQEEALNRILKFGDIGAHGDDHDVFQWQPFDQQYERLKAVQDILKNKTGKKIFAFRPPETVYDENTIKALKQLNYTLLASDNIEDRSVPQFYDEDKNLIIIPETGHDDYDLIVRFKIMGYKKQAEKYLLDYNRVNNEGGLYVLYYHTQLQCLPENVEALKICIDKFKENDTWITTSNKAMEWWLNKKNLQASIKNISNDNFEVELKNSSGNSISDAALSVNLNFSDVNNHIQIFDGNKALKFDLDKEKNQIKIYVDEILSYETKRMKITNNNIQ